MKRKKREVRPWKKLKEWINRMGTLNFILILVGAFFVWFNWQMLQMFRDMKNIPETYACAVVTATIGECGICGWIKTTKERKREHQWETENKEKPVEESEVTEDE